MKISIVIAVRNGEKNIGECLASVVASNSDFFELIVVDNGSTDKTKEIIESYCVKDQRVKYILEPQKGRGRARNAGIRICSGDIIVMTDADCVVPSDWLSSLVSPIVQGKAVAVTGFEEDPINNYWTRMRQEDDKYFFNSKTRKGYIEHVDTKNFAVEAKILQEIEFDPEMNSCEDWDLFVNLKRRGMKIMFVPEVLVKHYHDSSAKELFKTQLSRGFYVASIIAKHRKSGWNEAEFSQHSNIMSLRPRNFLVFPFWVLWQFIINPQKAPYNILADLAWKIGVIKHYLYSR